MSNPKHLNNTLLSYLDQDDMAEDAFEELALRMFLYQYSENTAYRNYCQARNSSPETVTRWHEIPALPTDAFKSADFPVVSFPLNQKKHTFLTSGTTAEQRGEHHFPSLELYEASIRKMWHRLDIPKVSHGVFLTPSPDQAAESSLCHMMGVLEPIVADHSLWLNSSDIDLKKLQQLSVAGRPVIVLGTALAFLTLFDQLDTPLILPRESRAMETGGYKGSRRQLEKEELYTLFEEKLGLAQDSVINEYSMTELSSQFYTEGIGKPHQGPPWTRMRVIDPVTGTDAENGEPGYLVIYDLANLHSVMAIQTQDIAIAHGNRSFTLLGRDPSALPRGCSRSVDN